MKYIIYKDNGYQWKVVMCLEGGTEAEAIEWGQSLATEDSAPIEVRNETDNGRLCWASHPVSA